MGGGGVHAMYTSVRPNGVTFGFQRLIVTRRFIPGRWPFLYAYAKPRAMMNLPWRHEPSIR